jgi:hypothetical protein
MDVIQLHRKSGIVLVRSKEASADGWSKIVKKVVAESRPSLMTKISSLVAPSNASESREGNNDILSLSPAETGGIRNKVFIFVSRLVNDKSTATGSLYAALIDEYSRRWITSNSDSVLNASNTPVSDLHSIIHHLTQVITTTTEVGTSEGMVTHTSICVDGLVLGKVYEAVFEDVRRTAGGKDGEILGRISEFKLRNGSRMKELEEGVSEAACHAYTMLSTSRTAVDKLEWAVSMMEALSNNFTTADSLLRAVVTHIIHIQPTTLFAQILFCEEFIRDSSAAMGKMGYALITLQAAAHFVSDNDVEQLGGALFEKQEEEEEEENVVVLEEEEQVNERDECQVQNSGVEP